MRVFDALHVRKQKKDLVFIFPLSSLSHKASLLEVALCKFPPKVQQSSVNPGLEAYPTAKAADSTTGSLVSALAHPIDITQPATSTPKPQNRRIFLWLPGWLNVVLRIT